MGKNDGLLIRYAVGAGKNLAKATNKVGSWADLRKLLGRVQRTNEKYREYVKLHSDRQLELKSINGWISGAQCDGQWRNLRNVLPRNLMTLDLDYPDDEFWDDLTSDMHWVAQFESFSLSTRSHNPSKQRYRMVLPMSRDVTPDEYGPLVRIFALRIDNGRIPIKQVDKVSARRAQMMFLPTASIDAEFKKYHAEGRVLDPDEMFAWFEKEHGDWKDIANLPLFSGEERLRKSSDKAEDPWLKPGPIGDWCRAWPIEDLISEFLSDIYVPGSGGSGKPRYTYTGGSASNGAVVEDDGRFLYSHHGTDPVGEQLVNAWDLYRVHKFGQLDEGIKSTDDTPISERPSSKAMYEFIKTDERYREERLKSRYDLGAMFGDSDLGEEVDEEAEYTPDEDDASDDIASAIDDLIGGDSGSRETDPGAASAASDYPRQSAPRKRRKNPAAESWFSDELDIDNNGNIKSNVHNVAAIVYNDPRFYDAVRWDEFGEQVRLFHPIRSKTDNVPNIPVRNKVLGDPWEDMMSITVRAILATPNGAGKVGYGMSIVSERDIEHGVQIAARRNSYHPLKEARESVLWDGTPRVDTLFPDYFGCPDTPYHREAARMVLVASIARIYEPGHKFDFAPVLQGPQGLRKSTFLSVLYGEDYFCELICDLNDTQKVVETTQGKTCAELAEVSSLKKSDHDDAKQFMSSRKDITRPAYGRVRKEYQRKFVVWGTTNDYTFLKDITGNRRWWPIKVMHQIDTDRLSIEAPQIWAEALHIYREMRSMQEHGQLPLFLHSPEAQREALAAQEGAREIGQHDQWLEAIQEWVATPVKLQTFAAQHGANPYTLLPGASPEHTWVRRTVFCTKDVNTDVLHNSTGISLNAVSTQFIGRLLPHLEGWERSEFKTRKFAGHSATYWYEDRNVGDEDRERGFVVVDAPAGVEQNFGDSDVPDGDENLI